MGEAMIVDEKSDSKIEIPTKVDIRFLHVKQWWETILLTI